MPSKSAKQAKFMAAAANSPSFAKKAGISQGAAREFHNADRKKRFAEGGETPRVDPRRSILREEGRPPRNYDPYEDLRRQYQTPGTVIRGDELPNSKPSTRPNMERGREQPVKRMAKGGKAGCGPMKKYAEGGKVDDREVIDFTGKELDGIERGAAALKHTLKYAGARNPDRAAQGYAAEAARSIQRNKGKSRGAMEDADEVMSRRNYAAGGKVSRGMGCAVRGGKYV